MSARAIDIHSHCIPPRYLAATRAGDPSLGARIADGRLIVSGQADMELLPRYDDVDLRIADMDEAHIGMSVISIQPVLYHYSANRALATSACRTINEGLVEMCEARPDRFAPMGTVPLQFPEDSVKELRFLAEDLEMCSVQISTHVNGQSLDQPELLPFFQAAEELGVLVFVHPSQGTWSLKELLPKYGLRNVIGQPTATGIAAASLIFGGVVARFPRLRFVLAHGGGILPMIVGRLRHGVAARDDTPRLSRDEFDELLASFYCDTLTHDPDSLRFLIDTFGSSRVVIGTDYPVAMGDGHQPAMVKGLGIPAADETRVLRDNMVDLLGLDTTVS